MQDIPDKSIDAIITDLPYGSTQCKWDVVIPFEPMWEQYNRIIKDRGVICLFNTEPFGSYLRLSNLKNYKYDWVWDKVKGTGFLNAKKQPMRYHELISVFYKKQCTYNPQMTSGHLPVHTYTKHTSDGECYGKTKIGISGGGSTKRYPRSIQVFSTDTQKSSLHSTQKPVALIEYLIKTYTNPGDLVLDSCAGSMTLAVAAISTGRNYICIEKDPEIYKVGKKRVEDYYARLSERLQ